MKLQRVLEAPCEVRDEVGFLVEVHQSQVAPLEDIELSAQDSCRRANEHENQKELYCPLHGNVPKSFLTVTCETLKDYELTVQMQPELRRKEKGEQNDLLPLSRNDPAGTDGQLRSVVRCELGRCIEPVECGQLGRRTELLVRVQPRSGIELTHRIESRRSIQALVG